MQPHAVQRHTEQEVLEAVLTDRQLECLAWVQEGKSAGDIGQIIGLSGRTVEKHIANACAALGVRTRVQAVLRARELGLIRTGQAQAGRPPRRD